MKTTRAAELKQYDVIDMPDAKRIVERIEFTDDPIDANGTTGVRIIWRNEPASVVRADREFRVIVSGGFEEQT